MIQGHAAIHRVVRSVGRLVRWRRMPAIIALLALAGYAMFLARHMGAYAAGADSSGYVNQARALARGATHLAQRILPETPPHPDAAYLYVPLGFRPAANDPTQMVAMYPAGLSLLIAASAAIVGWPNAPGWLMGIHSIAGILLSYRLGRSAGLPVPWSVLAATIVGLSPLYVLMSLQTMSDVPALVWTAAAVVSAETSRRRGTGWAIAAGAAFAMAVLVRPTNILAGVPIAWALGLGWRRWIGFGLGGLPGAGFLAWYNHSVYGAVVTTGYGDVSDAFSATLCAPTLLHYATWLPILLTPVVVFFLGLPLLARQHRRLVVLLGSWAAVFLGFYSFYWYTKETWWYLRFLLPIFPPLIVGALWALRQTLGRGQLRPAVSQTVFAVLLVGGVTFAIRWSRHLHVADAYRLERSYPEVCDWARTRLPADAAIATMQTSGALFHYTDFTLVRWDQSRPEDVTRVKAVCSRTQRELFAILFPFEEEEALQRWDRASWVRIGQVEQATIWRHLEDPRARSTDSASSSL